MPASVYAAEISSPEIRGRLTTLVSISISMGVLIIYLLGFFMPVSQFFEKNNVWWNYNFVIFLD